MRFKPGERPLGVKATGVIDGVRGAGPWGQGRAPTRMAVTTETRPQPVSLGTPAGRGPGLTGHACGAGRPGRGVSRSGRGCRALGRVPGVGEGWEKGRVTATH